MAGPQRRDDALAEWSRLHGGFDPRESRLVLGWLRLMIAAARPLAALRVAPTAVTAAAVVVAAGACPLAAGGPVARGVAAAVVAASAVLDGVDGALAVTSGRTTRFGSVADSLADRVADGLYAVALSLAGAPAWLAVAAAAAGFLLEFARARAGAAGMTQIGRVTVGERPTRVVLTSATLLASAVLSTDARDVGTAGTAALLAVGVVGLAQFVTVARRFLTPGA